MARHLEHGRSAEQLAAAYLVRQGLTLVASNHRARVGELDLVMREGQIEQVGMAISDIQFDRKDVTPGRIVAALTFSFWTTMFGPDYETLWQQALHRIARRPDGKGLRRKDFSAPLHPIRPRRSGRPRSVHP